MVTSVKTTVCLCAVALSAFLTNANAEPLLNKNETGLRPYIAIGTSYDSNIFRAEDNSTASQQANAEDSAYVEADSFLTLAAGFDLAIEHGPQRLELDAEVERESFVDFDALDHTGLDVDLLWQWRPIEQWQGRVRASYEKARRSFDNQLQAVNDTRKNRRLGFASQWQHRNNIRSILSVDMIDTSFENAGTLDKQRLIGGLAVHKLGQRDDNYYGVELEISQAEYDQNVTADYDEYALDGVLNWQALSRVHIRTRLGWAQRDLAAGAVRDDFSGVTGSIVVDWHPRKNLSSEAEVYRKLSSLSDEIADYAEVFGFRLAPEMHLTAHSRLKAELVYENRDFSGNDAAREDTVFNVGISALWQPSRAVEVEFAYNHITKDSNLRLAEFETNMLSVSARLAL